MFRTWLLSLGVVVIFLAVGSSATWAQAVAPAKGAAPGPNGVGLLGSAPGNGTRIGGGGAVGGFGGVGFGGGIPFPGMVPAGGGFGLIGGPVGGAGVAPAGGVGGVRPQPAPRLPTPTATPKPATVDRELTFDIASDAAVSKLQASSTGLNYVAAKFEDIQVGQRLSLSPTKKGAVKTDEVTGTVLAVNAAQKQVTVKVSLPAEQPAPEGNQPAQTVTIRSSAGSK